MTDHKAMLNEAFHLCNIYHRKHRVYPVRIGINVVHSTMTQYSVKPSIHDEAIPFVVDSNVKPNKMWFYNEQGKADTSTLLNATVFVKLAMLPEAIQEHFRAKMEARGCNANNLNAS